MKRGMKRLALSGLGLVLVGGGILLLAAIGGRGQGISSAGRWVEEHLDRGVVERVADHLVTVSGNQGGLGEWTVCPRQEMVLVGTMQKVSELELTAESVAVRLEEREDAKGGITVYARKDERLQVHLEEDGEGRGQISLEYSGRRPGYGQVVIEVPADFRFEQADFSAEASKIEISAIQAEMLKLELEAGLMQLDSFTAGQLQLDASAGEVNASGSLKNGASVSAQAASVNLQLDGQQEDYRWSVDHSVGSVTIGTEQFAGVSNNKQSGGRTEGASEGAKSLDIDCEAGSVAVQFGWQG